MLSSTVAQRYSLGSVSYDYEIANEHVEKDDFIDAVQKMNPPWNFQPTPDRASYGHFNTLPRHHQNGFDRGGLSSGSDQRAPTRGHFDYEQASHTCSLFGFVEQPSPFGEADHAYLDNGPAASWQRQQTDTYRPFYSEAQPSRQGQQADPYRYSDRGFGYVWRQQQADTYRATYFTSAPPRVPPSTDKHGEWRGQAIRSATSASQQTGYGSDPRTYQQPEYQYAPFHFPYQQFPPFAMLRNAVMQELMPRWQSGHNVPPNNSAPMNSANVLTLDANAQSLIPNHNARPLHQQVQSSQQSRNDLFPSGIECLPNPQFMTRSQRRQNRQAVKDGQHQQDKISHDVIPLRPRRGFQAEKHHVMERPLPTDRYLEKAGREPQTLKAGRPLLVVLDLNGTLIHRPAIGSTKFTVRPKVNEFLHYLFSAHHVLLWSSVMPANLATMARKLLSKTQLDQLVGCWARDRLRIPQKNFHGNVYVYKQLSWIWKDEQIIAANPDPVDFWCQENTVLIEDSVDKTASEPFNAILVEEFKGERPQVESDVLGQVVRYLETLKCQSDVSAYIKSMPFKYDEEAPPFDWMPIINDMH